MELPNTAKKIENSVDHWVDIDGSIYCIDGRNNSKRKLIKKAQTLVFGYKYCGIRYKNKGTVSKRVHRLVAEAFIPNPKNLKVIGHKNNIKSDNRVENLYWTTTSENTKKAFDDGLANNAKGYDDSQSKPVVMFDTYTNEVLGRYGSIIIAGQETGIPKTTIARQAKYKRPVRKPFYFRYQDDVDANVPDLVGMFDVVSNKLLKTFLNVAEASKKTGIPARTVASQVERNKVINSKYGFYFKKLTVSKCEQTIETLVGE